MKKKFLTLILALILMASLFILTACGSSSNEENSVSTDDTNTSAESDDEITDEELEEALSNQDTNSIIAENYLLIALSSVQSEYYAQYALGNVDMSVVKEYCTQDRIQEALDEADEGAYKVTLGSWNFDEISGTLLYEDTNYNFTLVITESGISIDYFEAEATTTDESEEDETDVDAEIEAE